MFLHFCTVQHMLLVHQTIRTNMAAVIRTNRKFSEASYTINIFICLLSAQEQRRKKIHFIL